MCHRSTLLLALLLGVTGAAVAQTSSSAAPKATPTASTGLSRAEVLADLELWQRAGMTYWPAPPNDSDVQLTAEYQAGLARYQQLQTSRVLQDTMANYQGMPAK